MRRARLLSFAVLLLATANGLAAARLIDFKIEPKIAAGGEFLRRQKRGDQNAPVEFTLTDEDDSCDEAPPTASQVYRLNNEIGEELVGTGIDVVMPDGTVISRLQHRVNGLPVWSSGATVRQPPKIRGLCAGPSKLPSSSGPRQLNRFRRQPTFLDSETDEESVRLCRDHWGVMQRDEIYTNSTRRYAYNEDGLQTVVVEVDITGLYYFENMPFRILCLIDSETNAILRSWDGLQSYFGDGGNRKTNRYRYGETADRPQLPAQSRDDWRCQMENAAGTVKVYDMKSGSARIIPGLSLPVTYNCATGPDDETNGAYGPLADCFYNTNRTAQFLLDPEWGFSEDMRKYSPSGQFRVGAHFKQRYDNAFWDGSAFYVGDGRHSFLPLCTCEDVVAHEIGHSVTQMTSDLVYSGESGCLNEAFSDMMAEAFEFYLNGDADYKIGVNCMKTRPYLRDMSIKMSYNKFESDTDPHHCSAIFNYAFYKLAKSNGWGMRHAWKVFLNANVAHWSKTTTMQRAACDVAVAAGQYKLGGDIQHLVAAFRAVDIDISGCLPDVPRPVPASTTTTPSWWRWTQSPSMSTSTSTPWWTTGRPTRRTTTAFSLPDWLTWLPDWLIPDSWTESTRSYTRMTFAPATWRPTQTNYPTVAPPASVQVFTLSNCEDLYGLSADTGESLYFMILIDDGSSKMNVYIDAFNGDADLYIKAGSLPSLNSYDHRPYWRGSIEWVRDRISYQGWYYIMIHAARGFRDLTLDACFI